MNKSKGVLRAVGSAKAYKYSTIAKEPEGEIPKAYLLPCLPDILDQGSVQSCVAHSVAESFQAQSSDKAKISVLGVYGLWRKHRGEGMYPETALDIGRTVGTTKREIAPENLEVPEAIDKAKEYLGDTARCEEDVLSYIAFPQVAENFFEKRREAEEHVVRYSIQEI